MWVDFEPERGACEATDAVDAAAHPNTLRGPSRPPPLRCVQAVFGRLAGITESVPVWQAGLEAAFLALAKNNVMYLEIRGGVTSVDQLAVFDAALATVQVRCACGPVPPSGWRTFG